jgi:uncharacterized protein (TIGR03435 family)
MQSTDDGALLRQYTGNNSEKAFAELVARHVNLVYSVAFRRVGNPHQAEEIAQAVFIILAKKAGELRHDKALSSWLFQVTRFTANNFVRSEARRQRREQEAYTQTTLNESGNEVWPSIAPLLDTAVAGLNEKDRRAIVLRFYEGRDLCEIGVALGANEEAAKKRVNRAVEKLRCFFRKRGVVVPAGALTAVISANSVQAAPAALAQTATAMAIAKGASASASTLTLAKGALKIMAWTKAKTAIVVGLGVLLTAGTATVTVEEIAAHRHEAWQSKFDLSVLEKVPPHVSILPSLPSTTQSGRHIAGTLGEKSLGYGQSVSDLLSKAYGIQMSQLILGSPVPEGKFDFIANLTKGSEANQEALRQEIKRKFGLTGRRKLIMTNVLVLAIESRNASRLKTAAGQTSGSQGDDYYSSHGQNIWSLVDYLEHHLGTPVIDQTGLTDDIDIDLKYDSTPEGLKRALSDELGLKLTPDFRAIEFVVVEKAN